MLHDVEIDWGWPRLNPEARAIVRNYEARLKADRQAHTVDSVERVLEAAAHQLPGKPIRARAVDDDHRYGWQVVDGEIYPADEFDEAGMFPGELTAEDFRAVGVTKVMTPIVCPDAILEGLALRGAPLATLVQKAWQVAADVVPPGFRTPSGPRRMQTIYLPVETWAEIKQRADDEGRTMSYLVQRALTAAYKLAVD